MVLLCDLCYKYNSRVTKWIITQKGPFETFHVRLAFNSVVNDLVPFLHLFVHKQRISMTLKKKKNLFHLSGEITFLKCHVLTLVGCLQIFPAAHLSQYRWGGETSEKSRLLGLGPTESSCGSPALVFRKTPVLQLWGGGFNSAYRFPTSFHFRASPKFTCP